MSRLIVDPDRPRAVVGSTGIFIRAWTSTDDGVRCVTADISELTKASLLDWLRSRGGDNPWAEDVVGIVLGHGHLHTHTENPS